MFPFNFYLNLVCLVTHLLEKIYLIFVSEFNDHFIKPISLIVFSSFFKRFLYVSFFFMFLIFGQFRGGFHKYAHEFSHARCFRFPHRCSHWLLLGCPFGCLSYCPWRRLAGCPDFLRWVCILIHVLVFPQIIMGKTFCDRL